MNDKYLCKTCKTCVQGDQLVYVEHDIHKPIKEIVIGDIIIGFDEKTKLFEKQTVLDVIKTNDKFVVEFKHITHPIVCTEEHPVLSSIFTWIDFKESLNTRVLAIDDIESTAEDFYAIPINVTSAHYERNPTTVYTLKTELGNFIVNGYILKGVD